MLPSYNTCRKHIEAYINYHYTVPEGKVGFRDFWKYKVDLENKGCSILDEANLGKTASKLRDFLDFFGMRQTGIAETYQIQRLLQQIRPSYEDIRNVKLGSGEMCHYRDQIETIYEGLDGVTNRRKYPDGSKSYIAGKSKAILAIWGQTPGFDNLTRKRFRKWTHPPEPRELRPLRRGKRWYEPSEFYDMIAQLDEWVIRWSESNDGKIFSESFSDLCPDVPIGRIIDMIYNWELPDPRVD